MAVALKLKSKGKSDAELVNNFIPYLICKTKPQEIKEENAKKEHLSDKAYHPDDLIASKGTIEIDVQWYIEQ